jgi:transcriptional regulator with GAF, ATPase, and Fis domain
VGTVFELGTATFVMQRARGESARPSWPSNPALIAARPVDDGPVVTDPTMRNIYALLDVVAPSPLTVLILGETGVGKEVYAEAVHKHSPRAQRPLLQINCAALPESILEGELFGYQKGAFTGAVQAKAGLFEAADGGTVFLDEIGELPMGIQAKLLRVLESGQVMRLGSVKPTVVDVRFIAATNRDLRGLIAEGRFRADLYFRLNGMSITLPPLRARRADIEPLALHLLGKIAPRLGRGEVGLTDTAVEALKHHDWPGNVRELRNVLERALLLCKDDVLGLEHLHAADSETFRAGAGGPGTPPLGFPPSGPPSSPSSRPGIRSTLPARHSEETQRFAAIQGLRDELRGLEKERILDALSACAGNQSQAARMLGMSRSTLIARIEEYGLARPRKRGP